MIKQIIDINKAVPSQVLFLLFKRSPLMQTMLALVILYEIYNVFLKSNYQISIRKNILRGRKDD